MGWEGGETRDAAILRAEVFHEIVYVMMMAGGGL